LEVVKKLYGLIESLISLPSQKSRDVAPMLLELRRAKDIGYKTHVVLQRPMGCSNDLHDMEKLWVIED
jgi:hypothetical protein